MRLSSVLPLRGTGDNSMGLILDARSSQHTFFPKSIAYRKAEAGAGYRGLHSGSSLMGRHLSGTWASCLRSPVEGAGLEQLVQVMITK